ncbi:unnamed protein product [Microthlaspi erraticum]|uniref:Transcription factor TFIIB cyclin-like domain-containing protein n=1 Tax=Microthlaspi erraticum TaxID=1685480 RepID=A0A6D2IDQ0_9BRAS|nr:unnamed protein product [Microthlaspi erraticum]CAA7032104.1 unnamed protein product [Microthlaspi erraticum]
MWNLGECCKGCKSKDRVVIDHEARKTHCSECGLDSDIGDSGLSNVTTEQSNGTSGDFLSLTLGNSQQGGGSAPVSVANTTVTKKNSSDLEYSEKRALDAMMINLDSDPVSIAAMSFRLCLPAKVNNKAKEIFKKVEKICTEKDRVAFNAACIYIACRQEDMTRHTKEICSAVTEATMYEYDISKAIGVIAEATKMDKKWLMEVKAADFINRFCANLGMDGKAVKAAQEAAKSSEIIKSFGTPRAVAAVIVYVIARISDNKKKLLKDVLKATGVERSSIRNAYKNLYTYLPTIIPKGFADLKDLHEALGRP